MIEVAGQLNAGARRHGLQALVVELVCDERLAVDGSINRVDGRCGDDTRPAVVDVGQLENDSMVLRNRRLLCVDPSWLVPLNEQHAVVGQVPCRRQQEGAALYTVDHVARQYDGRPCAAEVE